MSILPLDRRHPLVCCTNTHMPISSSRRGPTCPLWSTVTRKPSRRDSTWVCLSSDHIIQSQVPSYRVTPNYVAMTKFVYSFQLNFSFFVYHSVAVLHYVLHLIFRNLMYNLRRGLYWLRSVGLYICFAFIVSIFSLVNFQVVYYLRDYRKRVYQYLYSSE